METCHKEFLLSWGCGCLCLSTTALRGPSIPQDIIIMEKRREENSKENLLICQFGRRNKERVREVRGIRTDSAIDQ